MSAFEPSLALPYVDLAERVREVQAVFERDGTTIDEGIRHAVTILNAGGIETYESCDAAHDDAAFAEPTVRFHGGRAEGFRAFAWAKQHNLPVAELRRFWVESDGELEGPHWEMTFVPPNGWRHQRGDEIERTFRERHQVHGQDRVALMIVIGVVVMLLGVAVGRFVVPAPAMHFPVACLQNLFGRTAGPYHVEYDTQWGWSINEGRERGVAGAGCMFGPYR